MATDRDRKTRKRRPDRQGNKPGDLKMAPYGEREWLPSPESDDVLRLIETLAQAEGVQGHVIIWRMFALGCETSGHHLPRVAYYTEPETVPETAASAFEYPAPGADPVDVFTGLREATRTIETRLRELIDELRSVPSTPWESMTSATTAGKLAAELGTAFEAAAGGQAGRRE